MTITEDGDGDQACDSRLVAYLAVHMVKQILDDAYVIANSTVESGQPWQYPPLEKTVTPCKTDDEEMASKSGEEDDSKENDNKKEEVANELVTSTPQKDNSNSMILPNDLDDLIKCYAEGSFIGQGDEDLDLPQNESSKSTSTYMCYVINHLFDMSEVEKVCDDNETLRSPIDMTDQLIIQAMANITKSYVDTALGIVLELPSEMGNSGVPVERSSSQHSDYSFLSDAFKPDFDKDIAFYLQDTADTIECETSHFVPEVDIKKVDDDMVEESNTRAEAVRFENAYLSLNRDDEQGLEDDGNIILEDPKGMTLQEVELMTANTSNEDLTHENIEPDAKCEKSKELNATSAVTTASSKSLVSRCRSQGARLLACLRGWWRRRTPGNRKEHQHRVAGAVRGLCPLSPDARRRTASLIDHRLLQLPSPVRTGTWKFNTVNETVVNSTRWKEYTFVVNPDEKVEF